MKAKVTKKSPYGFQVNEVDEWVNYGNYYKGTKEFNVGDEIDFENNGKYLVKLAVLAKNKQEVVVSTNGSHQSKSDSVRLEIARGTAVKALYGSPVNRPNDDMEVLAQRAARYILTGSFDEIQETK